MIKIVLVIFLALLVLAAIYRLYMFLIGLTVDDVKDGHYFIKPDESA